MDGENLEKQSKTSLLFWLRTKGRAGRKTWWLAFVIMAVTVFVAFFFFKSGIFKNSANSFVYDALSLIVELLLFLGAYFYVVISIKRLHDLNLSFDDALAYCGYALIMDCFGGEDSDNPILNVIGRIIACLIALLFLFTVAIVVLGVKRGTSANVSNKFGGETLNII